MDGLQTMKNTIEDEDEDEDVLVKPKLSTRRTFYETICDCMGKLFNKLSFERSILSFLYVHVVVKQLLRLSQQPHRAPSTTSIGCLVIPRLWMNLN
jgi:hypothetical protein